MACFTSDICSNTHPKLFCPEPKPSNSSNVSPRCTSSDYIKLKKNLTMNKYAISKGYQKTYPSYEFKSNLLWGKYVNDTICLNQCNCVFLY